MSSNLGCTADYQVQEYKQVDSLVSVNDLANAIARFNSLVSVNDLANAIARFKACCFYVCSLEQLQLDSLILEECRIVASKILSFGVMIVPNLTILNLSYSNLTEVPSIWNCSALKHLVLHRNNLIAIPNEIGRLRLLESLDLGGNQLSSLPASLGRLGKLERLVLTDNLFTTLPKQLCRLKLISLELDGNRSLSVPFCAASVCTTYLCKSLAVELIYHDEIVNLK